MSDPIKVAYGSTVGIVTCTDNRKVYIDGVYAHAGYGASTSMQIYFVPNGGTSDAEQYRLYDKDVAKGGNEKFEIYASPFCLQNTGDAIYVGTGDFGTTGAGATCTFIITGWRDDGIVA